jgi:uracil-DNA glycosylase
VNKFVGSHYCHGILDVAFVFSVPGANESRNGCPVAGQTGSNLSNALRELNFLRSDFFGSTNRYDYRITNAFDRPIARALGDEKSEARISEVRSPSNVRRVVEELSDCRLVVLCGRRAQLLSDAISKLPMRIVHASHIGNAALNRAYPSTHLPSLSDPAERRQYRIRMWTSELMVKLSPCD